jgi:hypothetical protein
MIASGIEVNTEGSIATNTSNGRAILLMRADQQCPFASYVESHSNS